MKIYRRIANVKYLQVSRMNKIDITSNYFYHPQIVFNINLICLFTGEPIAWNQHNEISNLKVSHPVYGQVRGKIMLNGGDLT